MAPCERVRVCVSQGRNNLMKMDHAKCQSLRRFQLLGKLSRALAPDLGSKNEKSYRRSRRGTRAQH